MYKMGIKRIFDIVFSILLLPFLIIIVVVVSPLIYFGDFGTIFYVSDRRGLHGEIYKMYKFRTMKMNSPDYRNSDGSTYNSNGDDRLTKVGKLLRKTSIDELPQLFNVLKGDMSFIGPRPTLTGKGLEEYNENMKKRIKVRPGLTGYSQAYYRNSINQEEKYQYDAFYAENLSFVLDLKVLIKTIVTILKRENVYNKNSAKGLNNE
ncbi:sugar transferase [Niallia endozanthoxylica]|uniref:Sugar transferase n=1 Tax=Niallia endozanthoxylica TaxID=2036016 RepID=A0A5J5H0S4_9BACI|nr:sugar transferase [Niallia endozanthoxylica]KAA9013827.1 sugar transferase [Niallia endozanthoxylica]